MLGSEAWACILEKLVSNKSSIDHEQDLFLVLAIIDTQNMLFPEQMRCDMTLGNSVIRLL